MGIFNIFKKRKQSYELQTYTSDVNYKGINVEINYYTEDDIEEIKNNLNKDYSALEWKGIENLIKEKFIPWLKGSEFIDMDNNKIYDGLRLYAIEYSYHDCDNNATPEIQSHINNKFGKGIFTFHFESSNDYTSDMLEAVAMVVEIRDGKIVEVSGLDV